MRVCFTVTKYSSRSRATAEAPTTGMVSRLFGCRVSRSVGVWNQGRSPGLRDGDVLLDVPRAGTDGAD